MQHSLPFFMVDAFADSAAGGNPAGIVLNADVLTRHQMAHFAGVLQLSECGFLVTPDLPGVDFGLKVFYPAGEVGFVATVLFAACAAFLEANEPRTPGQIVVEQQGAVITVAVNADGFAVICPPPDRSDVPDARSIAEVAAMLSIGAEEILSAQYQSAAPPRIAVQLADAEAVLALEPGHVQVDICAWGYHRGRSDRVEARVVFPGGRDPVCGNSSGWIGYGFLEEGSLTGPVKITQGGALGREGVVTIYADDNGNIIVAGPTFTRIVGEAKFEL